MSTASTRTDYHADDPMLHDMPRGLKSKKTKHFSPLGENREDIAGI